MAKLFNLKICHSLNNDKTSVKTEWILEMDDNLLDDYLNWLKDTGQGFMSTSGFRSDKDEIDYLEKMLEYARLIK